MICPSLIDFFALKPRVKSIKRVWSTPQTRQSMEKKAKLFFHFLKFSTCVFIPTVVRGWPGFDAHRCGLSSIPRTDVTYGLSLLLVPVLVPNVFLLVLLFLPSQKPTF